MSAPTPTARSYPSVVTGFTTQPDGTQAAFFTAASIKSGGPAFRVQATRDHQTPIVVRR